MKGKTASCVWILCCCLVMLVDGGDIIDDNYRYDGTEASLDKQFYYLSQHSDRTPDKLGALRLPKNVTSRLDKHGVNFSDLSPWLQRALLWDSGLVLERNSESNLIQVYTPCHSSMTGIALTTSNYKALQCTFNPNCSDYAPRNGACSGDTISRGVLCATDSVSTAFDSAMWATGGSPDMIPEPNLVRHRWTDGGKPQLIFAIHTLGSTEVHYADCPKKGKAGMIIPCVDKASSKEQWCVPVNGEVVTSWLKLEAGNKESKAKKFNAMWLVLIFGLIIIVLILVIAGVMWFRKKRGRKQHPSMLDDNGTAYRQVSDATPPSRFVSMAMPDQQARQRHPKPFEGEIDAHAGGIATVPPRRNDPQQDNENNPRGSWNIKFQELRPSFNQRLARSTMTASDASSFLQSDGMSLVELEELLMDSPVVRRTRIPLVDIERQKLLACGTLGEVWLCDYVGRQCVVKQLLAQKADAQNNVLDFVNEIKLTASLEHPAIVSYIGVVWRSFSSLGMVLEYLPGGDLRSYLEQAGDALTWEKDKLVMAVEIGRAVQYLHTQRLPIVHRDIKSKNVLLSAKLHPKLIDFGVSRDRLQEPMTAQVQTPYWCAPEVLEGRRYTEKSDIFSFGVLLSELDTGVIPYRDMMRASRANEMLQSLEILKRITEGSLRPTFSSNCPDHIVRLASMCLDNDINKRPTATQVVYMLFGSHM